MQARGAVLVAIQDVLDGTSYLRRDAVIAYEMVRALTAALLLIRSILGGTLASRIGGRLDFEVAGGRC